MNSSATLNAFVVSNPDPHDLKRALTVKMALMPCRHRQIQDVLGIAPSFIELVATDFRLAYQGS